MKDYDDSGLHALIEALPEERREDAAVLLDNQVGWYNRLVNEQPDRLAAMRARFGSNWIVDFLTALVGEFSKLILPEMARFEVASAPIHFLDIATYRYESASEDSSAQVSLHFYQVERKMYTKRIPPLPPGVMTNPAETFRMWMEETFQSFQREVLGDMKNAGAVGGDEKTCRHDELMAHIKRESFQIHRKSFTGPGNKILVSPEGAVLLPVDQTEYNQFSASVRRAGVIEDDDGRWDVYVDPFFPADEVLVWRYASDTDHSGMATMLYLIQVGDEISTGALGGCIRSANFLYKPEFFKLLRIT